MFLLLTSFISGIITVLTPCVLPLLPIILGGSVLEKDNKNKYIIIISLILSIVLFTLILKFFSIFINVSEDFWRNISAFLIIFLGISFIFPEILLKLKIYTFFNKLGNNINKLSRDENFVKRFSFTKNALTGIALGPIFSSCSPTYFLILAVVLPASFGLGIIYLFAYSLGVGLMLLFISLTSEKLLSKINIIIEKNMYKKIVAGLFIFTGISIFFGIDTKIQESLPFPKFLESAEAKILNSKKVKSEKTKILETKTTENKMVSKTNYPDLGVANELTGIVGYINVKENTTLKEILAKNKVVMLEFWTYSCINCKRTLPYVNSWYEKYHDKGFEIVGVHTPEFAFEKVKENIIKNAKSLGIKFPIFMDNNYTTWNAYNNQYWPMRILIIPKADGTNQIIYTHAGEGDYENNESIIKQIIEAK